MFRKASLTFVILLLLSSSIAAARAKKASGKKVKTASANALKAFGSCRKRPIPLCPSTPNGHELQKPPEITANANHILSTTLAVYPATKTVPVLSAPFGKTEPWTCVEQNFPLQLFKNPVTGTVRYPGPTFRRSAHGRTGAGHSVPRLRAITNQGTHPNRGRKNAPRVKRIRRRPFSLPSATMLRPS
jgi:hypothetical protein